MNLLIHKLVEDNPEDAHPEGTSPQEIKRYLGQVVQAINAPYTIDELRAMTNNGEEYVEANIGVDLWELAENGLEWLNDTASEQITGSVIGLEDIGFSPVGADGNEVIIKVTGSVKRWLNEPE